jgi:hypothetical protein
MLTSAKVGKQNGDTRTRKPEPGYLNLSNMIWQTDMKNPLIRTCSSNFSECWEMELANLFSLWAGISDSEKHFEQLLQSST